MREQYTEFITHASRQLAALLLAECSEEQLQRVHLADHDAATVLRAVGREAMQILFATLADRVTDDARRDGYRVERRPRIRVEVLFGAIEFQSPYLRQAGAGLRPVADRLGITHAMRTPAVERALTDFGAEESFAHAAERFAEHYGWEIGSSSVLRVVESVAAEAQQYVAARLSEARRQWAVPLAQRCGAKELLVELDGCEIRTVVCGTERDAQDTVVTRTRQLEWKEVRVGLAGHLDSQQRTYVAKLGSYPEVGEALFEAAVVEGLSPRTTVIAVADGGQGLREELATQFPGMQFILDKMHLVSHLYETAEALGLSATKRKSWVADKLERISAGRVQEVITEFQRKRQPGDRLRRLTAYLTRFQDAVSYDEYHAQGYPLGSGEVESAHRYIPQKRLKIAGASWKPETVNQMLAVRVMRANGWWAEFWQQRQAKLLAA
ncbi:MAG: hypothetical protein M3R15_03255 [Acidobacteriota bacterium]|nr:hypothetical protein [Acidobacteriota bacterium]